MSRQQIQLRWMLFSICASITIVVGLAIYRLNGIGLRQQNEARDILHLKNRSLALMENGSEAQGDEQLIEAAEGFRRIVVALPKESLGYQNLCIALLQRIHKIKSNKVVAEPESQTRLSAEFQEVANKWRTLDPESYLPDVLTGRLAFFADGDQERAVEYFQRAANHKSSGADADYQAFWLLEQDNEPRSMETKSQLMRTAKTKAPRNLFLAATSLVQMAIEHDAKGLMVDVPKFLELAKPITERIESEVPELLNEALVAVESGNWSMAITRVGMVRNVLKGNVSYQNDIDRLNPHDLDYIQLEFSERFPAPRSRTNSPPLDIPPARFQSFRALPSVEGGYTALTAEDCDLDGRFDLWFAANKSLRVWSLANPNTPVEIASVELSIACSGIAVADLDRDFQRRKDELPTEAIPANTLPDGSNVESFPDSERTKKHLDTDLDLVIYGAEGVRTYRNDFDPSTLQRQFTVMPQSEVFESLRKVRDVAIIDLDHDSDLDLAIVSAEGVTLWSNMGNWVFADFTPYSLLPDASTQIDRIIALDVDRNVLNDFLLASEVSDSPMVLSNNLYGRYALTGEAWTGAAFGGSRAVAPIDANADACWDVVSTGEKGTQLTIMKSPARRGWSPDSNRTLSSTTMHDLLVEDFDNNGCEDVLAWGDSGVELFFGNESGGFALDSVATKAIPRSHKIVTFDFDLDGDEDLACLTDQGAIEVLLNEGNNVSHHLDVVIRADEEGTQFARKRCNMHGVGSLIELKSGDRYQARIVRGTKTRFGLGSQAGADVLRILWTNGIPNNVLSVQGKTTVYDQQNLGGSCPYLYAWNGQRFEFCTDCLWAAPIGLQIAQGTSAPFREWEYIKVDSHLLQPRNNEYVLQMTEELWESVYCDSVKLLAVDHPASIEVHSNEKVGPSEISQFKVHTVSQRLMPSSVVQQNGQDVTEVVAKRDQRYSKSWDRGFTQGLVEDHWLEVDFGKLTDPKQITLFLTGWLFPASTSLNVANSQNPMMPKTKPPAIHVPDKDGQWHEAIPYAGFPGGKTNTIAIDLSGKFLCDDFRVRIVTNMELCWDEVFFTVDDPKAEFRITELPLLIADVHYRGFSAMEKQPFNAPKRYEYNDATTESIWPPMAGAFTRYGDVTDLISDADDMQVVMGSGDEMTIRFSAVDQPIPEGWVRDFMVYNVGWDKDADLNTIHGQQVEPLPFRAMRQYPYEPDQSFPSSQAHRRFLREFQTRFQKPGAFWNQIRDWTLSQARQNPQ